MRCRSICSAAGTPSKRGYRIARELDLRIRPKRRIKRDKPDALSVPAAIRLDNGPEYMAQALVDRANDRRMALMYIRPGKPNQNAYIERFNRTVWHEWLWRYSHERPHTAIGGVAPRQLLSAARSFCE
jgi:transposase InsO family protein